MSRLKRNIATPSVSIRNGLTKNENSVDVGEIYSDRKNKVNLSEVL
jgi:hypothetical protein